MSEYKIKSITGASNIPQFVYTDRAKANKSMILLAIPDSIIADATAATKVTKGSLIRIKGDGAGYVTFGPDATLAAPGAATANAILTPNDFFYIIASDEFIRTNTVMRCEVLAD